MALDTSETAQPFTATWAGHQAVTVNGHASLLSEDGGKARHSGGSETPRCGPYEQQTPGHDLEHEHEHEHEHEGHHDHHDHFHEVLTVDWGPDQSSDGRDDTTPDPEPDPEPEVVVDLDPDPAPPPVTQPPAPAAPTELGRPDDVVAGPPQVTPPSLPPSADNATAGRPDDAMPDITPPTGPVNSYTSGGPADSSYNVTIEFVGTWTTELQGAFTEAADYLSTIILEDLPDAIVDGVPVDDISITATLQNIDGVGGVLGSAGPREVRDDGSFLPSSGAMTFDSADASALDSQGNWDSVVLHEMLHALGFGTLWNAMGLVVGSVAGGDIRFTGQNAIDNYLVEFADVSDGDPGAMMGVPVETTGGPGTAGGHWDEFLFDEEIMTGYIDDGAFISVMTIAALEDMGYDTAYDSPYSSTDLSAPLPGDPLLDLMA